MEPGVAILERKRSKSSSQQCVPEDPPWDCLMADVFEAVLKHLDEKEISACRLVSHSWHFKVDSLLQKYHSRNRASLALVSKFKGLQSVTLCIGTTGLSAEHTKPLAALSRLRCLSLVNERSLLFEETGQAGGLAELAACRNLAELSIQGCHLAHDSGIGLLSGLRTLTLSKECRVDEPLAVALQGCSLLQSLSCDCLRPGILSFDLLLGLGSMTSLRSLSLRNWSWRPIWANPCDEIAKLTNLTNLDLGKDPAHPSFDPPFVTDAAFAALTALRRLRRLSLGGAHALTDAGVEPVTSFLELEYLDLRCSPAADEVAQLMALGDEAAAHLSLMTRLTGLRLGYCQIGPVGCASLAKLRGLTLLEISGCAGVTDAALCMLSPLCAVTDLTLSGCVDFGNLGFASVVRAMPALRALSLAGCYQHLTDVGIASLASSKALEDLDLSSCSRLGDQGVATLVGQLPKLACLSLRDCERFSDAGLRGIAALRPPKLASLNLEHCTQVTDVGVRYLVRVPALSNLMLFGSSATETISQEIQRSLPGCSVTLKKNFWWM